MGKSCLLHSYATDDFKTQHVATVFDHYESLVTVNGEQLKLEIWDVSSLPQYESLREYAV